MSAGTDGQPAARAARAPCLRLPALQLPPCSLHCMQRISHAHAPPGTQEQCPCTALACSGTVFIIKDTKGKVVASVCPGLSYVLTVSSLFHALVCYSRCSQQQQKQG